jgi:hypothetical protein
LCKGKTLVDKSYFSLNSAFFQAQIHRVREIPVVRGASLSRNEWVPSGGPFVRFIRGWKGDARRVVGALWLRAHGGAIRATGRSVEGLGIPADNSQLHTAGLSVRESFYRGSRSLLRLPESRVPQVPQGRAVRLREDWVRTSEPTFSTRVQEREWLSLFRSRCHHEVWQPHGARVESDNEVRWQEIRSTGLEPAWHAWKRTTKRAARLLGRGTCLLNLVLRPPADVRRSGGGKWIPREELPALLCSFPGVGYR